MLTLNIKVATTRILNNLTKHHHVDITNSMAAEYILVVILKFSIYD